MPLLNLNAITAAKLQNDPFDFLVVPDCIDAGVLTQINSDYPPIETAANHNLDNLVCGAAFMALMEELRGPALAQVLGQKFNLDLASLPTTVTVRKFCERTDGNIHTDHKSKIITVLAYFNTQWTHAEGQIRLLRSNNNIDDYAAQVPPLNGTILVFRRTDHSWHGHTRFIGERRMVQLNYLDQSPIAVAAQRVSRFTTRFMKNVLGMR